MKNSRNWMPLAILLMCMAVAFRGPSGLAQATHPPAIVSISVCSPTGSGGQGSCPSGSFDTHQIVLAPDGNSINKYGLGGVSDEHSSVFSPGMLGSNSDYLFFVASGTKLDVAMGATVLSGGAGPDKNGQWTFDFPNTDGYGSFPAGFGHVLTAALLDGNCPKVSDGNPAHQDQTPDLSYAAPGSIVKDPTSGLGSLLMIYEGVNHCPGSAGPSAAGSGYISVDLATSLDYGKTWATYRGTPTFSFVPLPGENKTQGPNAPSGALGASVCMGNDCTTTPPSAYGRYPVLTPESTLATVMATGRPLAAMLADGEPSAFLDDASGSSMPYIYEIHGYHPGTIGPLLPGGRGSDLMIARAKLNGGTAPLSFMKWNGQSFGSPGIGGTEMPILPDGPYQNCGEPKTQNRTSGSISYVEDTQQYLLLFTCNSPTDPASGQGTGSLKSAAWFYSTSYDLSDPTQWSSPREVIGSWSLYDDAGLDCWKGFYPTLMSLNKKPSHLGISGYFFYMWGCGGGGELRQYSSRAFTITTGSAAPTLTPGSLANGATYISGGLVPGSWAQVKGSGLSPATRTWGDSDFTGLGNKLPTNLSGVQVHVNNLPAAVYYIDAGQVSFQVPAGITGTASVQVLNNGQASNMVTAAAAASSPGIFPIIVNGVNYPAGVFLDGKYVGDPAIGPAFRKAKPGDVIQLYATALVATPAGVEPLQQIVNGVMVTIGSVTFPADFAALVAVGEFQVNFTVPQQIADGTYPISIQVNGASSPATINSSPPGPIMLPVAH